MAGTRRSELLSMATHDLWVAGWRCLRPGPLAGYGGNVRFLERNGTRVAALVQCRTHDPRTQRYLVGIQMGDLVRVEYVVLWLEDEPVYFMIPAGLLRTIHEVRRLLGDARYTGPRDEQWRVDVQVHERSLSPQGSSGCRYDISEFAVLRRGPAGWMPAA